MILRTVAAGVILSAGATGCGHESQDALIDAFEYCQNVSVELDDEGEFRTDISENEVRDNGTALYMTNGDGQCVLNRLDAPARITETFVMGEERVTDSWDGYTLVWSWTDGLVTVISLGE